MERSDCEELEEETMEPMEFRLQAIQRRYAAAMLVLKELGKDIRTAMTQAEREGASDGDEPATFEQLQRLRELDFLIDRSLTKAEAEELIGKLEKASAA